MITTGQTLARRCECRTFKNKLLQIDKGKKCLAVSGGKWRGAVKKGREFPGIGTLFLSQFLFVLNGKLHLAVIYGGLHSILLRFLILFFFLLLFFISSSFRICFNGFTTSGASFLKRLKQIPSINCVSGAFHGSCLQLSTFPYLSGFNLSSLLMESFP